MNNYISSFILFFGSMLLIFILLLIIAYMLVYRGATNQIYILAVLYTPLLYDLIFGSPWEEFS